MTVILNEQAIGRLFLDPAGPVGRTLERRSEQVLELARENARKIMWRNAAVIDEIVTMNIGVDELGLRAQIGIDQSGKIGQYLSAKEQREHNILEPALKAMLQ